MCWGAKGALDGPKKCQFAEGSRAKSFDARMGLVFEIYGTGFASEMSTLLKISESVSHPAFCSKGLWLCKMMYSKYLCFFCLPIFHQDKGHYNSKSQLCHRAYINQQTWHFSGETVESLALFRGQSSITHHLGDDTMMLAIWNGPQTIQELIWFFQVRPYPTRVITQSAWTKLDTHPHTHTLTFTTLRDLNSPAASSWVWI